MRSRHSRHDRVTAIMWLTASTSAFTAVAYLIQSAF